MSKHKQYSHSQSAILCFLANIDKQISSILLGEHSCQNPMFYQNYTQLSLKALKFITALMQQIADDKCYQQIKRIHQHLAMSVGEYKKRERDNPMDLLLIKTANELRDKESEDEIEEFISSRSKGIFIRRDNDSLRRERSELEEYVKGLEESLAQKKQFTRSKFNFNKNASQRQSPKVKDKASVQFQDNLDSIEGGLENNEFQDTKQDVGQIQSRASIPQDKQTKSISKKKKIKYTLNRLPSKQFNQKSISTKKIPPKSTPNLINKAKKDGKVQKSNTIKQNQNILGQQKVKQEDQQNKYNQQQQNTKEEQQDQKPQYEASIKDIIIYQKFSIESVIHINISPLNSGESKNMIHHCIDIVCIGNSKFEHIQKEQLAQLNLKVKQRANYEKAKINANKMQKQNNVSSRTNSKQNRSIGSTLKAINEEPVYHRKSIDHRRQAPVLKSKITINHRYQPSGQIQSKKLTKQAAKFKKVDEVDIQSKVSHQDTNLPEMKCKTTHDNTKISLSDISFLIQKQKSKGGSLHLTTLNSTIAPRKVKAVKSIANQQQSTSCFNNSQINNSINSIFYSKGNSLHKPSASTDIKTKQKVTIFHGRDTKYKLKEFIQLIEFTHERYCGPNCKHITQFYKNAKDQSNQMSRQIIRLLSKSQNM